MIHRLTYRRTNHDNIHVRGYKEEGTITTPFDMTVLNDLDRFHLVMDTIDRLPQAGDKGINLKQQLKDKRIEHKQYIDKYGQDLPEIRDWRWGARRAADGATTLNQALPMVYIVRHGDTTWTLTAQHTGRTDLPHRREDLLQPIEGV